MSSAVIEDVRPARPLLIPSAATISVLNLVVYLLARHRHILALPLVVSMLYTAVVLLRTRDVARLPQPHRTDAVLCRWSGVLMLLFTPLAIAGVTAMGLIHDFGPAWARQMLPFFHTIAGLVAEFGTIMGVAAWKTPRDRLLRPAVLWRILSFPCLFVNVGVLVGLLLALVFQESPAVSGF